MDIEGNVPTTKTLIQKLQYSNEKWNLEKDVKDVDKEIPTTKYK